MIRGVVASALPLLALAFAGCAADTETVASGEEDVVSGAIEELLVPISDYETSRSKSAKVAKIKIKGKETAEELARCHQHYVDGMSDARREIIVCRDDTRELVMDSEYGDDFTRFARARTKDGKDQFFTCKQVSQQDFSPYFYGGMTDHSCRPIAQSRLDARGKSLFVRVDAEPTLDEYPTRSVYLPTFWKKTQPETWASWNDVISRAMPVGEYVGHGSSGSKKCKVKVAKEGDGIAVSIHGLDDLGAEKRVQARIVLSSATTYGAMKKDGVPQKVSSATRPASVLVASAETETRTDEYYARNLRIVRYPDAPASVDAGHTAIFIDENYCQRLGPKLPTF